MTPETAVPKMMTRVESTLLRAVRGGEGPGARGPLFVYAEGDDDLGIAHLRDPATIRVEFHSGSDRPVVGPAIRFAKRAVRRLLRWYVTPMWEQQNRFNHALLDMLEKLRLQNETLRAELDELRRREPTAQDGGAVGPPSDGRAPDGAPAPVDVRG
jgi:hypothetical protein